MTRAALACGACAVVVGLGAPANGAAPARAGTIAFEATGGLYLIDAAGGRPRKIPGTQPGDGDPAWSPNGKRLAFDRRQAGEDNRDIYVMNVDGSDVRQLTTAPSDDAWPEWARDGRTLAFVSDRDGRRSVYAIKVRRQQRGVLRGGASFPTGRRMLASSSRARDSAFR
jgi:Tol biopolymer transport system component